MVLNLWVVTPLGLQIRFPVYQKFILQFIKQQNYSYEVAMKIMLWLGSPQHEEMHYRVAALGRLRTTVPDDDKAPHGQWTGRVTIFILALLLKSAYRFSVSPIRFPMAFFKEQQ